MWGVDDGCELLDAHHAHVGDGEGAALVLVGGELVGTSAGDEILDLVGDGGQALGVGVGDNGGDQASGGRGGDANVGGVVPIFPKGSKVNMAGDKQMLANEQLRHVILLSDGVVHPGAVGLGDGLEGKSGGLDDEVVDGQLVLVLGGLVEDLAELQDLIHLELDGDVVVGDGLLGLGQTLSNDLAHVGERDVGVSSSGRSSGGGSSGGLGSGGSLGCELQKNNKRQSVSN